MTTITQHYQHCFNIIASCKTWLKLITTTFVLGMFFGAVFHESLSTKIFPIIAEIHEKTHDLDSYQLAWFIAQNNIISAFVGMISGIALGIIPFLHALINGIVVGFVLHKATLFSGISAWWKLVPHGLLELPAIFIALSLGINIDHAWWHSQPITRLKINLTEALQAFILVVVPLLLLAAPIESFISANL